MALFIIRPKAVLTDYQSATRLSHLLFSTRLKGHFNLVLRSTDSLRESGQLETRSAGKEDIKKTSRGR